MKKKKSFLEKLRGWLFEMDRSPKQNLERKKLKTELSTLISLDIVGHGRPFSDGLFIKDLFIKVLKKLNYNETLMKLSRNSIVQHTAGIAASLEQAITEKLKTANFIPCA